MVLGIVAVALIAVLLGSLPVKIVASVVALCTLQGLWRGASELVGIVVGMILAVILCRPFGRLLEPAIASLTTTGGLSARLIAIAIAAIAVTAFVAILIGVASKRVMKSRPQLHGTDKLAGGGLGLIQGSFLSLLVLWIPLAMEPIASAQARRATEEAGRNAVAEAVSAFAQDVRTSGLGSMAEATNPVEGTRLFALAGDFAIVMRSRPALDAFNSSPVMTRIRALPSMQQALERLQEDPSLGASIRSGNYSADTVRAFFTSRAVLDVLDQTTLVSDLMPLAAELEQEIQKAKQIAQPGPR